jgi:hypothetical protein
MNMYFGGERRELGIKKGRRGFRDGNTKEIFLFNFRWPFN